MNLVLSPEQCAFRDAVQSLLTDNYPASHVSDLADSSKGWDESSWQKFVQMGLVGLSVPESLGGAGATLLEEVILFEQCGQALLPGPLYSTVALALPALLGSPLGAEVVPDVVSGKRRMALAWIDPGGESSLSSASQTSLTINDKGIGRDVEISGIKKWVMDVECVDSLVVAAKSQTGAGLYLVDMNDQGITWQATAGIDGTRRTFDVTFDRTRGRSLVDPANSSHVFDVIWQRGLLFASAEAVGSSTRLLELSAEYATDREQFGQPIGSYQAISHQLADLYMHIELARSLCYWSALESETDGRDAAIALRSTASVALPGAIEAAHRAIQVFGGVGMTWESIIHRYLRRSLQMSTIDLTAVDQRHHIAKFLLGD